MIEILNIIFIYIIIIIFLTFPLSNRITSNKITLSNKNIFEILLRNSILFSYSLLIFSIFNISQKHIFLIYLFLSLTNIIIFFSKKKVKINFIDVFLIFFIIISFSIVINISYTPTLMWDGLAHWLLKVKVFFYNEEIEKIHNLPFNYYPHLGSYIWAFFWKNSFLNYEYTGRIYLVILYVISIFSLINLFNNHINKYFKLFLLFTIIYLTKDISLFGGYQEYFLFIYLLLASKQCLTILSNNSKYNNSSFVLFLASSYILTWFKQEGLVYFVLVNLILLIYIKDDFILKIKHLLLIILLLILNFYLKKFFSGEFEMNELRRDFFINFNLKEFLYLNIFIMKHYIVSIFKYPIHFLIFLIFIFQFKKRNVIFNFYLTYFIISLLLIFSVFQSYPGPVYQDIPLIIDRLILQMSGFYLPYMIFVLNNKISNKNITL